jgi:plastocyanin
MNKVVIALTASVAAGLVVLGTALAHGPGPVRAPTGRVVKIQVGSAAELTIVHIIRGCHNGTDGKTIAEKADVTLRHGARLTILNQDVDRHRVMQMRGPRIATGKAIGMNKSLALRFAKPGLYRFMTVTSEMPGMPEMKTIEPDYRLILVVHAK